MANLTECPCIKEHYTCRKCNYLAVAHLCLLQDTHPPETIVQWARNTKAICERILLTVVPKYDDLSPATSMDASPTEEAHYVVMNATAPSDTSIKDADDFIEGLLRDQQQYDQVQDMDQLMTLTLQTGSGVVSAELCPHCQADTADCEQSCA